VSSEGAGGGAGSLAAHLYSAAPTSPAQQTASPEPTAPPKRGPSACCSTSPPAALAVGFGGIWRLTLARPQIRAVSALAGILCLLLGFIVGGLLSYLRARLRARKARGNRR